MTVVNSPDGKGPKTGVADFGTSTKFPFYLKTVHTPKKLPYPLRAVSSSRSSTRRTLPEMVLGSSVINSILRGYL